jgi:hypothetical protein
MHARSRRLASNHPQQERGGAAAQDRPVPAREHSRCVRRLGAQRGMPDAVYAGKHPDQVPFVESVCDPAARRTRREQLPARDNAVLATRYRGNYPI